MKNKMCYLNVLILLLLFVSVVQAKTWEVFSPDKKLKITVNADKNITYAISWNGKEVAAPSPISMTIDDGLVLGINPQVAKAEKISVNSQIIPVVKEKRAVIPEQYNELKLTFTGSYGVVFRAYNDAAAWRFLTMFDKKIKVYNEQATFTFAQDDSLVIPLEPAFNTSFERLYDHLAIATISPAHKGYLPMVVTKANGLRVALAEADLDDYPGMFLRGSNDYTPTLVSQFAPYPLEEKQFGDRSLRVTKAADYIAETDGNRAFPWRVLAVAENDVKLIENDIVYRLSTPLQLKDASWIKPGKVAWDWWNALNLKGVNFKAGVNTDTYKYYIDFASKNKIEYIILDEGWSDTDDLLKLKPNVDLKELIRYGNEKHVGLILWCVWLTVDKQLDEAFSDFEAWGIKGVKIDFMDRDDQKIVNWYKKITVQAAEHHLLVDFHGAFKPSGLRRAYPNLITREGVRGAEYNKWADDITPDYNVTIPYTRMFAGPMDYTPGAMCNTEKGAFRANFARPMSQGTRTHQLAMYVVYESPLQMLCDTPTNYEAEPEVMKLLGPVPTVWDETIGLDGKIGDYVLVARRSGNDWYIGAMNDWTPRTLKVDLSFLGEGEYKALVYSDGINAAQHAEDFSVTTTTAKKGDVLEINLAPGGGWVARLGK
ncbi:MAG TPA: glycoside hydrolase family 97 protein [bacterium]|nr:glycoside hydrolase family 97 protein [bacterium]HPN44621.1 glycoside hydrolase family 97 protein [bacterium]